MIVLDTHVLYWLVTDEKDKKGNSKLGRISTSIIEQAWQKNQCYVSAISFWEIAMLCQKNRIKINIPVNQWYNQLVSSGFKEISVTGEIGILSTEIDLHSDPADRIITATAISQKATLITADGKLLNCTLNKTHSLSVQNARQ